MTQLQIFLTILIIATIFSRQSEWESRIVFSDKSDLKDWERSYKVAKNIATWAYYIILWFVAGYLEPFIK